MQKTKSSMLSPGITIKIVYCVSLLAVALGAFLQSGWVSLAIGGGMLGILGMAGLLPAQVLFILLLFRVYVVATSSEALDARHPNLLGWILRFIGQLIMWLGILGLAAQFLVRPLTLLIFGGAKTESGAEFFVIGLYAAIASGTGWIGCLLFEISRICGKKVQSEIATTKSRWPFPNGVALASIAALVIGFPYVVQTLRGEPCYGKLLSCTAKIEILAERTITLDKSKPVRLETNLDSIIYRSEKNAKQVWREGIKDSVASLGYAITDDPAVVEKITVQVGKEKDSVVIRLLTIDQNGTASHQISRFVAKANLLNSDANQFNVEVNLPSRYQGSPSAYIDSKAGIVMDGLFSQIWSSFISTAQEQENKSKKIYSSERFSETVEMASLASDSQRRENEKKTKEACAKVVKMTGSQGAKVWEFNSFGSPMTKISFISPTAEDRFTFTDNWEGVRCNDDGVWTLHSQHKTGFFRVRQFSNDGRLLQHVQVPLVKHSKEAMGLYWDNENPKVLNGQTQLSLVSYLSGKRESRIYLLLP